MSKKTIQQVQARQRKLLLRLRRDAAELVELDDTLTKMRTGRLKVAPPAAVKVTFGGTGNISANEFGDVIPTFGPKSR